MLTMARSPIAPLTRLLIVATLFMGALVFVDARPAQAQEEPCWDDSDAGKVGVGCGEDGDGEDGEDGDDGSGGEPACDLSPTEGLGKPDAQQWCEGENACWANIPSSVYPDPEDWPPGRPNPDAVYIYKECYGPGGETAYSDWSWYTPDQPSIEELAWEAYSELTAPNFRLAFSPPEQSVIYIETWWWAEGATTGEIRGNADFGVVAIGEPDRLEVDPGDGSDVMTCPVVTTESDDCAYTYDRASGDEPYAGRARIVYDVRIERNGEVIEVPGVPDTLESAWEETPVPVGEHQTVVR